MDLHALSLAATAKALKEGKTSSVELTGHYLSRIEKVDPSVKAYMTVARDEALAQAREADKRIAAGKGGPLTGVPIALKDNMSTTGLRTTCSSKMLENYIPPYDAHVVERLKAAGAVILGKTNLDEFAMGSSTENSAYERTRNPWNLDAIPGGSSGGSAAAVAADLCAAALGSDTGGSIRQPASCCGIVGLKPTYGRVSRFGLVAFASSLDQIGPMAKTVEDAALLSTVIDGHDGRDSTSVDQAVPDYMASIKDGVKGLKIGLPKEYFVEGMDTGVEKAVRDAVEVLKGQGAEIVEISLPHSQYCLAVYYLLATSEASSNLARYDGVRYGIRENAEGGLVPMYQSTRGKGFGPEVKRRIMLGTYALSSGYYDAYYLKAQKVRTLIKQDFDKAFEQVDIIATPTAPTPAFKAGEKTDDPLTMYLSDILTISANLAGIPAMSQPCGFSNGLPVGLQLMAKPFNEETLFKAGHAYEQASDWHEKKPDLN